METIWQDLRYAARGFRRTPTFALTVVATIALGLGILTALFTAMNAYYLRPLPVRDPHSLYEIFWLDVAGAGRDFTWPQFREFLAENPAFSQVLTYRRVGARVNGRIISGILTNGEYFQMLGVGPALGRTLVPADAETPGSQPVVVLSYAAWQNQFGGDPNIVGSKLLMHGHPFEVVGVAASAFNALGERPTDFWAPLTMAASFETGPDLFGPARPETLALVGRLKPGVDVRQAQAGVKLWVQRFGDKANQPIFISRATAKPFNPKNALMFSLVMAAFTVVLLIGCTNVANMMLARGVSRQQEIGIRLSLGATRGRLVRQLLTESILLALPAAAAGLLLSQSIIGLCIRVLFATIPQGSAGFLHRIPTLPIDWRVTAFGFGAALLSALSFGLAPALQATRPAVMQKFRPVRLRNALVIGQITVCVLLLISAALLLRGFTRIQTLDATLSTRDSITMSIQEASRTRVLTRLANDPAVEMLAAGTSAPVDRKALLPVMPAANGVALAVPTNRVSPEYFSMFEIPIVRGRNFTADEARAGSPVAMVDQTTAGQLWPHQDAIGQSLRLIPDRQTDASLTRWPVVTVVGVARDEISRWVTGDDNKGIVYFPASSQAPGVKLFLRVRGDAEAIRRKMDADITALDPDAIDSMERLQIQEWVAEEAYSFRVLYWMSGAIGLSALLLTLSGIYGVLAYLVGQRTKEIGIRMALGATTRSVTGLVLAESMRLAIAGIAIGGVLALGMSKILASVLVMINTFDGAAYLAGSLLVLGACAAAAYLPSRQAACIDPMITLRHD